MNSKSIEENFEIIERVGNGGYGSVYKVRNRLDDRIYAVKKIKLDCLDLQELDEEAQKVLKECRTLSLLDHPNILRYYGSWLVRARSKSIGEDFTSPHGRNSVTSSNNFTFGFKPRNDVGDERVSGILSFRRHNQQRPVHASQDEDNEPNEQSTPELYCKESPIYCKKIVPDDDDSSSGDSFTNRQTQLIERGEDVLYIQTEFCDLNLEQYLDERGLLIKECQKTLVTPGKLLRHDLEILPLLMYEAFSLGLQLIQALKYIHSKQKLIHRDLKPSNIFLNITKSRLAVKLGDFGLVKKLKNVLPTTPFTKDAAMTDHFGANEEDEFLLEEEEETTAPRKDSGDGSDITYDMRKSVSGPVQPNLNLSTLSVNKMASQSLRRSLNQPSFRLGASMLTRSVGTKLYASPEQLASSAYNYKTDIYSLGIILLRLFTPTFTQMETLKFIEKIRGGSFRETFTDYFQDCAEVIKKTVIEEPSKRPDLEELEKGLMAQLLRLFKELRNPFDAPTSKLFSSPSNKYKVGVSISLLSASYSGELDPGARPCILFFQGEEVLLFFDGESKSRFSIALKEYSFLVHTKRKLVGLKSNLRMDINLTFQTTNDLETFTNWGSSLECLIY